MEIRLLRYVLEVHQQKSFTKAAARLHIAQPSLSQQIGKFEQELGVKLFHRGHGSVSLTADGIRFVETAQRIVQMNDDLEREMKERKEGVGSELTIGAPAITGGHILPSLLRRYKKRFPHVKVQLIEDAPDILEDLIICGMTDISILALPIHDSRLTTHAMLTEPIVIALPLEPQDWMCDALKQRYFLNATSASPIALSWLSNAPFILLKQGYGFRNTVLELCAKSGFQPQRAYETTSIETAQSLAAYGHGITLLPAMVKRQNSEICPLYNELAEQPTRTLAFVYPEDRYLTLAARALLEVWDESQ